MLEAHDLVNPSFNYEPRFNKPVLSYWMVAGLYKLFGVSVGVQRFGIAIGAMFIVLCAYLLAAVGRHGDGIWRSPVTGYRSSAGLWAAAGLIADPRLLMFARRIFIDVWLTAFMSLDAGALRDERGPSRAAPALPAADVRRRRLRGVDEGTRGDCAAGPGLCGLPDRPSRARTRPRHDDSRRRRHCRGDRRAVVRVALSPARLDLHQVVPRQREPRALHRRHRGATAARTVLLHPGHVQRLVPMVDAAAGGRDRGVAIACAPCGR